MTALSNDQRYDPTANVTALVEAAMKRQDDLRFAESRRVNEQLELRAEHNKEILILHTQLRVAESSRIDANRATDLLNVKVASDKAADQATVLASQVTSTADTLRSLVATNTQATEQRLLTLERASYEGKGKEQATDPQIAILIKKVDDISGTKSEGIKLSWSVLIAIGAILVVVWSTLHTSPQQVIYAPAPVTQPK